MWLSAFIYRSTDAALLPFFQARTGNSTCTLHATLRVFCRSLWVRSIYADQCAVEALLVILVLVILYKPRALVLSSETVFLTTQFVCSHTFISSIHFRTHWWYVNLEKFSSVYSFLWNWVLSKEKPLDAAHCFQLGLYLPLQKKWVHNPPKHKNSLFALLRHLTFESVSAQARTASRASHQVKRTSFIGS